MAYVRHLNPAIYIQVNQLWKEEIGQYNLFKLKYVLTHLLVYLESYLTECEQMYLKLVIDEHTFNQSKKDYVAEMSLALENFTNLSADKNTNPSINNKRKFRVTPGNGYNHKPEEEDHHDHVE